MSLSLQRALFGVAVGVLAALALAPQTRWMVREQLLISIGRYHLLPLNSGAYTTSPAADRHQIEAAAASAPNDFGLHYAAVDGDGHAAVAAGMRRLASRFPNEPALYANILRYDTLGAVLVVRPEGALLTGVKANPQWHPKPATPDALAAFDQTAVAGERADPDNAYFPFMRAVGLLAAHRDAEAEVAVRRAGDKKVWRDYVPDDIQSRWRLHEIAFGDKGAIPQMSVAADAPLPQYQRMRDVAQVLTYRAMQKEQAGDVAGGLTLRDSVRHYGDLMRVQSNFLLGAIVGSNLCGIACLRPGGAPPSPELPFGATQAQQSARYRSDALAFAAYARQNGRAEWATKALAEADVRVPLQAVLDYAVPVENAQVDSISHLINWWTVDVAVLANIFWLLALWALATVIYAGRGLLVRVPERVGTLALSVLALALLLSLLTALFFLVLIAVSIIEPFAEGWGLGMLLLLVVILGLGLNRTLRRISWQSLRRRDIGWALLGCGVMMFALYGLFALLQWQTKGIWATWATHFIFSPSDGSEGSIDADARRLTLQWIATATALIAPLLLLLGAALAARLRPAPRLAEFGASLRVLAPATACILLLVYGGLVLKTLRQEAVVREPLKAIVQREGPYFATRAGLPWPGAVR